MSVFALGAILFGVMFGTWAVVALWAVVWSRLQLRRSPSELGSAVLALMEDEAGWSRDGWSSGLTHKATGIRVSTEEVVYLSGSVSIDGSVVRLTGPDLHQVAKAQIRILNAQAAKAEAEAQNVIRSALAVSLVPVPHMAALPDVEATEARVRQLRAAMRTAA